MLELVLHRGVIMTHEWFNPQLPLSGQQLDLVPSGAILPSSEANFWDSVQYPTSGGHALSSVTNRFYYNNNVYSSGINYNQGQLLSWSTPYIPQIIDDYWSVSGIIALSGVHESKVFISYDKDQIQNGIFYYQVLDVNEFFESSGNPAGYFYSSLFSNAKDHIGDGINDFTIFNDYIHNYPSGISKAQQEEKDKEQQEGQQDEAEQPTLKETRIPYLSDLKVAEQYSVYGLDTDYLGYNATGSYGVYSQGVLSREYPSIGKFFGPESEIL